MCIKIVKALKDFHGGGIRAVKSYGKGGRGDGVFSSASGGKGEVILRAVPDGIGWGLSPHVALFGVDEHPTNATAINIKRVAFTPTPYTSLAACSRTDATIFWTCIKIAKALRDFNGEE